MLSAGDCLITSVQRIDLICPEERHGWRVASIEHNLLRVRVEHHTALIPIVILMVEVKPTPLLVRALINKTGRERLGIPIALLNDAHLMKKAALTITVTAKAPKTMSVRTRMMREPA